MKREIWKTVENCKRYRVSSLGRIVSNAKSKDGSFKILKFGDKRGYYAITIIDDKGKRRNRTIHRLVAEHFLSNPKKLPQLNHKNGIKTDNKIKNLEWCTQKENVAHAIKNGRKGGVCGSKHYRAKLNEDDIKKIFFFKKEHIKVKEIADKFNVSARHIRDILNGKRWKHLQE